MSRVLVVMATLVVYFAIAVRGEMLWQIGSIDRNNTEFALAPKGYSQFRSDGFFVVGRSEAKRDWPYIHPGPHDTWAGSAKHTFTIVFGAKGGPTAGECKVSLRQHCVTWVVAGR